MFNQPSKKTVLLDELELLIAQWREQRDEMKKGSEEHTTMGANIFDLWAIVERWKKEPIKS